MIKEMIKRRLSCGQYNESGEYETRCDIDFMLETPIEINVLGKEYSLDRIAMFDSYGDCLEIALSDGKLVYEHFDIPYKLRLEILDILEHEQKEGQLKKWCLTEDITENMYELLEDKDTDYCFGCDEEMSEKCTCVKRFYENGDDEV